MSDSSPIRVLVVEDEPPGAARVVELLNAHTDIQVLPVVGDVAGAMKAIRDLAPDLAFLDIQISGGTGFDVIRSVGAESMPVTVFVTAYDTYALDAFEMAAVDYLLKPFSQAHFEDALRKARRMLAAEDVEDVRRRLADLVENAGQTADLQADDDSPYLQRLSIDTHGQSRIVPVNEIEYIVADRVYAEVHTAGTKYVIRESLQTLESRLDPAHFFRVHRSAIVRLEQVEIFHRRSGGIYSVRLKSGVRIRVARSRREAFEKRLRGI